MSAFLEVQREPRLRRGAKPFLALLKISVASVAGAAICSAVLRSGEPEGASMEAPQSAGLVGLRGAFYGERETSQLPARPGSAEARATVAIDTSVLFGAPIRTGLFDANADEQFAINRFLEKPSAPTRSLQVASSSLPAAKPAVPAPALAAPVPAAPPSRLASLTPEPQVVAPLPTANPFRANTVPGKPVSDKSAIEKAAVDKPAVDKPAPTPALREVEPPAQKTVISRTTPAPQRRVVARVAGTTETPAKSEPGFFERLFGAANTASTQAMAYARTDEDSGLSRRQPAAPARSSGGGVAVYDIATHTVTLPGGRRLEAHSGLGQHKDNPSSVHVKNRGATPPNTYNLSLREQVFHGVRALRLTPTSGRMYGRDGMLAHSFMLGAGGDSNGCVVFRDYQTFLNAYLRGEIRQLVVVGNASSTIAQGY